MHSDGTSNLQGAASCVRTLAAKSPSTQSFYDPIIHVVHVDVSFDEIDTAASQVRSCKVTVLAACCKREDQENTSLRWSAAP